MLKKCLIPFLIVLGCMEGMYGQASCTWPLRSSTRTSVTSVGNVTGRNESIRYLRVGGYTGPDTSQQIGLPSGATGWITSPNDTVYVQFAASPKPGYSFFVDSVSLLLGQKGGSMMHVKMVCSTDSTFTSDTLVLYPPNPDPIPGGVLTFFPFAPQKNVLDGQTFYFRVYPWYDTTRTGKYLCPKNVVISGYAVLPGDSVSTSVSSLNSYQQYVGTPSDIQSYTVSGYGLNDSIKITPPTGFEVSSDGGSNWHDNSSPIVLAQSGGEIPGQPVTITVRMNAQTGGLYNGSIMHTSANAIAKKVAINGNAIDPITLSKTSLNSFQHAFGTPSVMQSYAVSGNGLIDDITITPPTGFDISTDGGTTWYTHSLPLVLLQSGGMITGQPILISVRMNTQSMGTYSGNITHSTKNAMDKIVVVNGITIAIEPTTPSTISFGTVTGFSIDVNFSGGDGSRRILVVRSGTDVSWVPTDASAVSGVNNDILKAFDQGEGNKIIYDGTGSNIIVTDLLANTMYYFAVYEYNVGPDNTENYLTTLPGSGSQTTVFFPDTLLVSQTSISYGSVTIHGVSSAHSFDLSGLNFSPASGSITVAAPEGYQISMRNDVGFGSSIAIPYNNGGLTLMTVYSRFLPTAARSYIDTIRITGGGIAQNIAVNGIGVSGIIGGTFFVSTTGNDSDPGTVSQPFATIAHAVLVANAGDTIYIRGGIHNVLSRIDISKAGDSTHYYRLWAYPGERVYIDRSADSASHTRGIQLSGSYWHIKGLDIYNAGDNGMYVSGSRNIIELCSFYKNNDSGLQLDGGASFNIVINCDSYWNYDWQTNGGNADGFAPKLNVGTGNYFYGCRAWQNSDDGWDGFQANASTTIENCWAFMNGYKSDGADPGSQANGNGFKMGGNYTDHNHVLMNCLSFSNKGKGIDQNYNMGSMTLLNCTGYGNVGNNYSISEKLHTGKILSITNCVELGNKYSIGTFAIEKTDSWLSPFITDSSDFISFDTSGVRAPRKSDGSLPDITFMHLAAGSDLINAGTDVGLPYFGTAPDLGCFESDIITSIALKPGLAMPISCQLRQNYPNPFNPTTTIQFTVAKKGMAKVTVVNILGQVIAVLFTGNVEPGKIYPLQFNARSLPSGVYFSVLDNAGERQVKKMLLIK